MSFWCHRFDQKINEIFLRISALASKKRLNQIFFGFLGDLKTPKRHFEINRPLVFPDV